MATDEDTEDLIVFFILPVLFVFSPKHPVGNGLRAVPSTALNHYSMNQNNQYPTINLFPKKHLEIEHWIFFFALKRSAHYFDRPSSLQLLLPLPTVIPVHKKQLIPLCSL